MKMIMTKLFLVLGLMFALTGCNQPDNQPNQPAQEPPQQTVKTETQAYFYTADEGGSITKIDASNNTVVKTIPADGTVHNVQISPDGNIVGATLVPKGEHGAEMEMEVKGSALFYDTSNDKLIKQVQVGDHPAHIVFTQDNKYALVTNNADNNVSVIDMKTFNVIENIPTGKGPHGFRISADSKFAYIANMGGDTVSVVDLDNMKEVRKVKVGKAPVTTGISADGKKLFATSNQENTLAIIDLSTDNVAKIKVGNGPAQLYVQADGKYVYVANQGTEQNPSNTVSKVDVINKRVTDTIQTGKGSHGVVISPDNKTVYITNMYEDTVSVIDTSKNTVIKTVGVGETPNGITYKP